MRRKVKSLGMKLEIPLFKVSGMEKCTPKMPVIAEHANFSWYNFIAHLTQRRPCFPAPSVVLFGDSVALQHQACAFQDFCLEVFITAQLPRSVSYSNDITKTDTHK